MPHPLVCLLTLINGSVDYVNYLLVDSSIHQCSTYLKIHEAFFKSSSEYFMDDVFIECAVQSIIMLYVKGLSSIQIYMH